MRGTAVSAPRRPIALAALVLSIVPGHLAHAGVGPGDACADTSAEQVFGAPNMVGCAGSVTFAHRASLCASGWSVCSAQEWLARRGSDVPTHHYWTADDLLWGGNGTGDCYASLTSGNSCGAGTPMRVCAPASLDPLGNSCTWTQCGFDTIVPVEHFGGCAGNTSAGAICCAPPEPPLFTDGFESSDASAWSSTSPESDP